MIVISQLIDPTTHEWRTDLLETVLHNEDVQIVKSMPLPKGDMADRWIWHYIYDFGCLYSKLGL